MKSGGNNTWRRHLMKPQKSLYFQLLHYTPNCSHSMAKQLTKYKFKLPVLKRQVNKQYAIHTATHISSPVKFWTRDCCPTIRTLQMPIEPSQRHFIKPQHKPGPDKYSFVVYAMVPINSYCILQCQWLTLTTSALWVNSSTWHKKLALRK